VTLPVRTSAVDGHTTGVIMALTWGFARGGAWGSCYYKSQGSRRWRGQSVGGDGEVEEPWGFGPCTGVARDLHSSERSYGVPESGAPFVSTGTPRRRPIVVYETAVHV
jgi:hypothetical protein